MAQTQPQLASLRQGLLLQPLVQGGWLEALGDSDSVSVPSASSAPGGVCTRSLHVTPTLIVSDEEMGARKGVRVVPETATAPQFQDSKPSFWSQSVRSHTVSFLPTF